MSNAKDLMRLGGLWINKDRNGKQYLAGRLSADVRILIFKNEFRTEEKQPAYIMYLAPVERPEEGSARAEQKPADEFLVDELSRDDEPAEEPAPIRPAPRPAATSRPAAPAPRPAARPVEPPARGEAPARRPAPRRPEPDFEELEDPFAE